MKKITIAIFALFSLLITSGFAGYGNNSSCAPNGCCPNQEYNNCECPTICYVPCVQYCPQEYCVPRCEYEPCYHQKKCTTYETVQKTRRCCRMVPQYYDECYCVKVPRCHYETYCTYKKKTCYDKCVRYIPRCYYRKTVYYGNQCPADKLPRPMPASNGHPINNGQQWNGNNGNGALNNVH